MSGAPDFCPTSSLQTIELPTNDATPPAAHVSEGDLTEESNNRSDLMSVEALINKYTSHSRETTPSESYELDEYSAVNLKAEEFTNECKKVGLHENVNENENDEDEHLFPSSPAENVPSANDGEDTCIPGSNDTSEGGGEETFKEVEVEEVDDHVENLENHSLENR